MPPLSGKYLANLTPEEKFRRITVLWGAYTSSERLSGGEIRGQYVINHLKQSKDYEVEVICPANILNLRKSDKHHIIAKFLFGCNAFSKLLMQMRKGRALVYCTSCYPWDTLPAVLAKMLTGLKIAAVSHDTFLQLKGYSFFRQSEKYSPIMAIGHTVNEKVQEILLRFVDVPVAISDYGMTYLKEIGSGDRAVLSSNGIANVLDSFDAARLTRDIDVVYVGRVIPRKNLPMLIEALSLLERRGVSFKLLIITNTDGPEYDRLIDLIGAAELKNVEIKRKLSESEKYLQLSRCKVSVNLSRDETFSISTMESASRGCALLLSNMPFFTAIYNGSAIFVDIKDVKVIADKIEQLLNNLSLLTDFQSRSLELAAKYKNEKVIEEEFRNILKQLVA